MDIIYENYWKYGKKMNLNKKTNEGRFANTRVTDELNNFSQGGFNEFVYIVFLGTLGRSAYIL